MLDYGGWEETKCEKSEIVRPLTDIYIRELIEGGQGGATADWHKENDDANSSAT